MLEHHVGRTLPLGLSGGVSRVSGLTVAVERFPAPLGALCRIERLDGKSISAEVVGFREHETLLLSYGDLAGTRRGDRVALVQSSQSLRVGEGLLGRVLDARGLPLDGRPLPALRRRIPLSSPPPPALERPRIAAPLETGLRVLDALLTCGQGQRVGIFSGSGVGKSVLLGQLARGSNAEVNVIVLVGERGREVREFLERDLGAQGLSKSVIVVATSDEPALARLRAAFVGTAIAEFFRDAGRQVLLLVDSVTRFALAQREVGLAAGEPPATRGFPPSVFALLPRLLERSGTAPCGGITGVYTVLVEGDDPNEPIADCVRGTLDGHIMLSRRLAQQAHWPAIDVLSSVSRSMPDVVAPEHLRAAETLKRVLAALQQAEDLISVGAYQSGSNRLVDAALRHREEIEGFLRQGAQERVDASSARQRLIEIVDRMEAGPTR